MLEIYANVQVITGDHFPVRLAAVPAVGEAIALHSNIDESNGKPHKHYFTVVAVRHELRDVADAVSSSQSGSHSVTVFVKRSKAIHNAFTKWETVPGSQ